MRIWRQVFLAVLFSLAASAAAKAGFWIEPAVENEALRNSLCRQGGAHCVALVIGNDSYRNLSERDQLRNAANDARAMKSVLEQLGFTVLTGENLDRAKMVERLSAFAAQLHEGDIGFFYFSGHGVSLNGANYMLPTDISAPQSSGRDAEELLKDNAVAETRILDRIKRSGARIAVVALDACRNNPLGDSSTKGIGGEKGLSPPPETRGVLTIYAAGAGQSALDRINEADRAANSVFTRVFLRKLATPGLGLRELAFQTQGEVAALAASAGREQTPGVYSQIIGEDVFLAGRAAPKPAEGAQMGQDEAVFSMIEGSSDAKLFENFISRFPSSPLRGKAQTRLDELRRLAMNVAPPTPPRPAVGPCGGVTLASLSTRTAAPLSRGEECALQAKSEFKECEACPTMIVVPMGSFTMGSPEGEEGGGSVDGPQHVVKIAQPFAVGKFQVTRDEFLAFVSATGYDAGSKCSVWPEGIETAGRSFRNPGFSQRGDHPAACLNWNDAQAYVAWVSKTTGKSYRLLSESEWEYSARGGTTTPFWWGSSISTSQANYNGTPTYYGGKKGEDRQKTVPVDSFTPNPFGLYQMHGNVQQWVEDCNHDNYTGAPGDGSAWTSGDCSRRVLRGGSWGSYPWVVRAASRYWASPDGRNNDVGLRVARTLTP